MKVGITFGAYCPLHQGHLDVIMRAKKENDICFVIVCGFDGDRGGDLLPLNKRYGIISNFFKDDESISVLQINDTKLGIDESMSDYNWNVWIKEVFFQIADKLKNNYAVSDFTWYLSETPYKKAIERCAPRSYMKSNIILMDRNETPISGTQCREQPLKHWKYITSPFQKYFSHNILISGTASEGKTTLVKDLGKYFNLPFSYEKGRDVYKCGYKTDKDFDVKDFIYNIYEQNKYNEDLISSSANNGIFVSDTDNIVTLMYANAYMQRKGFSIDQKDYQLLYDMSKAYSSSIKWDKIFLLKPSVSEIVDDGERYMDDSDYEIRLNFYERLKSLYTEFGYRFEEIDGSYYEKFCKVRDYIKGIKES